jgi:hypothetical protein
VLVQHNLGCIAGAVHGSGARSRHAIRCHRDDEHGAARRAAHPSHRIQVPGVAAAHALQPGSSSPPPCPPPSSVCSLCAHHRRLTRPHTFQGHTCDQPPGGNRRGNNSVIARCTSLRVRPGGCSYNGAACCQHSAAEPASPPTHPKCRCATSCRPCQGPGEAPMPPGEQSSCLQAAAGGRGRLGGALAAVRRSGSRSHRRAGGRGGGPAASPAGPPRRISPYSRHKTD